MSEQVNELDQLELEGAFIDGQASSAEFTASEPLPMPSLNEHFRPAIVQFLNFGVGLVNSRITFFSQHFTPQSIEDIASAIVNVADIEGLDLKAVFGDPNGRIGCWIALCISVGVPAVSFYYAFKEHTAAQKGKTANDAEYVREPVMQQPTEFHGG